MKVRDAGSRLHVTRLRVPDETELLKDQEIY